MQIRISHRFPVSPRAYWEGTRDPALDARIAEAGETDVTLLDRRREGSRQIERMRVSPRKELPGIAQGALGVKRFTYVQVVESDDDTMTTTWKVLPEVLSDKVVCGGTSRVIPAPEGCERIIEGEIKVSIAFVGGSIERTVVEQLQKSYERAAEVVRRHLAGGG
jgi:hypothetical protein